ncbi:hypothetical protein E2I00_019533 [Balaenoptera physalus]|uniref:Clathrin/coatomer adaptor adaptin-like N-terminal domain-containing protein n=1 Tax=Balaenoptera physalus TaxID=9770 RepID=A0A6A1PZ04_BALPH|nr:hypothetical protein E2I00_019533 [Balaenoptera physalus]
MEAVNLLSSNRYTEKQIGYLFISVLVNSNSELIRLINNAVKNDLGSRNPTFTGLALHCIANVGSREMAEAFAGEIPKILVAGDAMDSVKQSAALCLLRLYRTSPDLVPMGDWTSRVVHLLNDQHLGVVTAAASLITTLAQKNPEEFKTSVSLAVSRLSRVSPSRGTELDTDRCAARSQHTCPRCLIPRAVLQIVTSASTDLQDYTYYFVPAPWLSVKLLRLLQCYPPPGPCPPSRGGFGGPALRPLSEPNLLVRACNQLGQFLQHRETNLRYLALESMCALASSEFSHEAVKTHIETVISALKASSFHVAVGSVLVPQTERDVSVRQRAVDLLYAMCDRSNAQQIFHLLHSKFHLCSVPTRALLLSTYIKFVNLFPEVKGTIQDVLRSDSQLKNADATVLEEMPPFPELHAVSVSRPPGAGRCAPRAHRTATLRRRAARGRFLRLTLRGRSPGSRLRGQLRQEIGSSRSILNSEDVKMFTEVCLAVSAVLAPSPPSAEAAGSGRRMFIFYGNKTSTQFLSFTPTLICSDDLQANILGSVAPRPLAEAACLCVAHRYGGTFQNVSVKLPITLNKFFQPTEMASQDFFQRWKQLSNPQQEVQNIFKAKHPMDTEITKAKIIGFGSALLEEVDPNPANFVGAGIIHTKTTQIGCLLRLEPNLQAQVKRLEGIAEYA